MGRVKAPRRMGRGSVFKPLDSMEYRGVHLRLKNYLTTRYLVLKRLEGTVERAAEIRNLEEFVNYLRNVEKG